MLDLTEVRKVLRTEAANATGYPANSLIAWENRAFTPPDAKSGTVWLRETLLVTEERKTATGRVTTLGQMRYDVFIGLGQGTGGAEDLAKAIADRFEPAKNLSGGGVGVQLYRTERRSGQSDPPPGVWFMIPVVIFWRSFADV